MVYKKPLLIKEILKLNRAIKDQKISLPGSSGVMSTLPPIETHCY